MKKDDAIVIERAANGYVIYPFDDPILLGEADALKSAMVFIDMGYASAARDNQRTEETLLGFIAEHFSQGEIGR